jgi:hypothetical protein
VYHDAKQALDERNSKAQISFSGSDTMKLKSLSDDDEEKFDKSGRFEYKDFDPQEFARWIGYAEETQCDEIIDALGIEQLSVYSREMSQSASNPCGMFESCSRA